MSNNMNKKCSSENHSDKEAIVYCNFCSLYMCKKCETFHSELFKNHNPISLKNNSNITFYNICKEKNHSNQLLIYYCNTHKILCCPLCISKIKTNNDGKHADCEIHSLDELKTQKEKEFCDKINLLKENIILFDNKLEEIKNISEKINLKKENIKLNVMKIFTELRNAINNREDELLKEIDKRFNDIYFNDNIIKENEIFKNDFKTYINQNKNIKTQNTEIIQFINELDKLNEKCGNIENKIKQLSAICNKSNNYDVKMEFKPGHGGLGDILNKLRNFGDILIDENNGLKIYKCFNTKTEENNVLLISNQKFAILHNLLKLNKRINNISIFPPEFIIPRLIYEDIYQYKIIIYDLQNSGYSATNNYEDIKKYFEYGGNIIVTHDHWTYIKNKSNCIQLLNAKLEQQNNNGSKKARILNNSHPIFKSHYNLNLENNSLINIAETHKTDTVYNDKQEYLKNLLIELDDNKQGEYLLVREIGQGKLIFWNAGHSYYSNGTIADNLTDIEQKLFMNFICWICD